NKYSYPWPSEHFNATPNGMYKIKVVATDDNATMSLSSEDESNYVFTIFEDKPGESKIDIVTLLIIISVAIIIIAVLALISVRRRRTPKPAGVDIKREVEFFQGFIRMKVGIQNILNSVITDVRLELHKDDTALRLDHIEPKYKVVADEVLLGNIDAGEKKAIAFYLDPLICLSSFVNATATYKDAKGDMKSFVMPKKKVDIVCPIFFTTEQPSTAMVRNLVAKKLQHIDRKVYHIPKGLSAKKVFTLCREGIQIRDVKHISDIVSDKKPFHGEAWYYGKTKVKKEELVIKASVRRDTNTIELFVASSALEMLTGLLAELGHNLSEKLQKEGIINRPIQQVSITIKDSVIQRSSLLFGKAGTKDVVIEDSIVLRSKIGGQEPKNGNKI
ncbi:hypothetical protein KAR91_74215, partial [Candidatus Pacearchaeota archaeon]|nr:hypothetical protein [Candidatus Pacearchaeota archaeon]